MQQETALHRLDARAKIVGFLAFTVVVVSTPARQVWAFVLYAALLAFVAGLARVPPAALLKRLVLVLPLLIAVAVFALFFGSQAASSSAKAPASGSEWLIVWNAGAKAILGVLSVSLLGLTTSFPQLISGLERLRTPRVFLLIASFMARYGEVFAEELRRSQRALASRNFRARWLGNAPVLGHLLAALFLRSYSRGERVYVAMLSRGYQGRVPLWGTGRFGAVEAAFVICLVGSALAIRLFAAF